METIRLNKFLASHGIASRRKSDQLILDGAVQVNGQTVTELGVMVHQNDTVTIHGKPVKDTNYLYILEHKPRGVVSTAADNLRRKTVVDLVDVTTRIYPVGRLDENSTGLILLTNDGELTNKLIHPRYHMPKTYHVVIDGYVPNDAIKTLQEGVELNDGKTLPAKVKIVGKHKNLTTVEITIFEGRNRQIRRMCAHLNLQLRELKRVAFGPIKLGNLGVGKWRYLTEHEVELLKSV